jgi:hypothetical protein
VTQPRSEAQRGEARRRWLLNAARAAGHLASFAALGPAAGALSLAACTTWPPPANPMPVRRIAARCAATARCILLPGALSRAEEFVSQGFVAELQAAVPACEVLLADAHLGYFVEGELLGRLRADAVMPGSGAPRPWLVGISLGGFAALAYAAQHGDDLAGVLALAPYLGRRQLLRDISAAGGPLAWSALPPALPDGRELYETSEEDLWRWMAQRAPGWNSGATPRPGAADAPPLFLGYGGEDRFADAHRVLQSMLPAGHSITVPGGHDWPPWRALWRQWLLQGWLAASSAGRGCAGAGAGAGAA